MIKKLIEVTERQKLFVDHYIQTGGNATQAAISAGYSPKSAYSIGNENLSKPEIKSLIAERLKSLESELIAKNQEILEYLTSVLRGEAIEEVVATVGIGYGKTEIVKVNKTPSIRDRLKAAETLCKIYGLFAAEKIESNTGQVLIEVLTCAWSNEENI